MGLIVGKPNSMVYVNWTEADDEDVNVVSFSTMEEAEEFVLVNNLSTIVDISICYGLVD